MGCVIGLLSGNVLHVKEDHHDVVSELERTRPGAAGFALLTRAGTYGDSGNVEGKPLALSPRAVAYVSPIE